jgi:tetratricopeptide (TPR) repeat protein
VQLPTATVAPAAIIAPPAALPTAVALSGLRHEWQTWNNCGPATLAMNLSYFGSTLDQAAIGAVLRRSADDKNVSPDELAAFAQAQGMQAAVRVNGSADLLRALVAAGYPVLIETWLEEHPNDGMGHYRLITGYDDTAQAWIAYDSYVSNGLVLGGGAKDGSAADEYRGIYFPYAQAAEWWKVFNHTYVLAYPPAAGVEVQAILGDTFDTSGQWAAAEATARAALAANPNDAFAWFNLGSSLWAMGRATEAVDAFDQARAIGLPWRMRGYQFAPFAAYSAVGRHADVLTLADATLANTDSIEEIYYWKARALAALGDAPGARAALDRALSLYPGYGDAATLRAAIGL